MRAPGVRGPQRTRRETSGVPRTRLPGTRGRSAARRLRTAPARCVRHDSDAAPGPGWAQRRRLREPSAPLLRGARGVRGQTRHCRSQTGTWRVRGGSGDGAEQSPPDGAMRKARGGARRARTAGRASEGAGGGSGRAGRGARPRGPGSCLVLWLRETAKGARRGGDKGTARHVHLQRPGRRAHGRS